MNRKTEKPERPGFLCLIVDDGVGSFDRVDLVAVARPGLGKRSRAMLIRLRFSYPLSADCHDGELLLERRLDHESGEAQAFYRNFHGPVRVRIEASTLLFSSDSA